MAEGPKKEGGIGGKRARPKDTKAWARFERTLGRMLRTPPQPRKSKVAHDRPPEHRETD